MQKGEYDKKHELGTTFIGKWKVGQNIPGRKTRVLPHFPLLYGIHFLGKIFLVPLRFQVHPKKSRFWGMRRAFFGKRGKKHISHFVGSAQCAVLSPRFFFSILSCGEKTVVVFALFIAPHICAEFFSSRVWELPIQISLGPNGQSLKKTSPLLLSFPQIGEEGKMLPIFAQWIFFSPPCQLWQMSRKIGRNGRFPLLFPARWG